MLKLKGLHHIAIICSDYARSKDFYVRILGFEVIREVYRAERKSYKLDLALQGGYLIELFLFLTRRPEYPDLRHADSGIWLSQWTISKQAVHT